MEPQKRTGLGPWYAMLAAFVIIALVGLRHAENDAPRERRQLVIEKHETIEFGDFTYAPQRWQPPPREQDVNVGVNIDLSLQQSQYQDQAQDQYQDTGHYYDPHWLFSDER